MKLKKNNYKICNQDIHILDEQRVVEQMNGENGEISETVPACDIIRITGQPENVAAAKQALLDLVPITIEVNIVINNYISNNLIINKELRNFNIIFR